MNTYDRTKYRFEKGIYFQSISVDITAVENEYDVDLQNDFQYCDGIYIPVFPAGTIIGLNDKDVWLVDKMPWQMVTTYSIYEMVARFLGINTIAAGTTKRIYIKCDASLIGTSKTFVFRLTDEKPVLINKRYKFFEITATGGTTTETLIYLEKNVKKVTGISITGAPSSSLISLYDDVRTYFDAVPKEFLTLSLFEPFHKRTMPVEIYKNKLYVLTDNPGATTTFYLLLEYEPHV